VNIINQDDVLVEMETSQVKKAREMMKKISKLGKNGITFRVESYDNKTEYLFTKLNTIKPAMIEEATKNARLSAQTFANDSQSSLGKIKSARQGQFSIRDRDNSTPYIKKVRIAGLSQSQAEEKISSRYRTYLKHPDIQIEVLNKRAYVIGEVRNPGEVPLPNERMTLLQLLAKAGDMTDSANRSSILIIKNGQMSRVHTKVVNLTDMNAIATASLMIEPNDIVYVMPNGMKAFNTKVNEISPVFQLIGNILQPFVNVKFLTN